jgi:hypothetical protein
MEEILEELRCLTDMAYCTADTSGIQKEENPNLDRMSGMYPKTGR